MMPPEVHRHWVHLSQGLSYGQCRRRLHWYQLVLPMLDTYYFDECVLFCGGAHSALYPPSLSMRKEDQLCHDPSYWL